jgi:hypothetical protein
MDSNIQLDPFHTIVSQILHVTVITGLLKIVTRHKYRVSLLIGVKDTEFPAVLTVDGDMVLEEKVQVYEEGRIFSPLMFALKVILLPD